MISIIAAVARDGTIGAGGRMPWHIAEDLRRFRALTWGHPVVMGRRTWESIGGPLEGRTNVVLTRRRGWRAEGAAVAGSLEEALAMFPGEEVFVIGGGEIYRQAMPLADRIYLTHIDADYGGDTHFPPVDPARFALINSELHPRGAEFPHPFGYADYKRVK